jgi:hypothetical protein
VTNENYTISISPELLSVFKQFVEAIAGKSAPAYQEPIPTQPSAAAPVNPLPTAPAASSQPTTAQAVAPVVQDVAPMPAVPVAAPTYTLEQLARAGATLAQAGKMDQCLALMSRYNVTTITQLNPEQYGAFATELRALGAQL